MDSLQRVRQQSTLDSLIRYIYTSSQVRNCRSVIFTLKIRTLVNLEALWLCFCLVVGTRGRGIDSVTRLGMDRMALGIWGNGNTSIERLLNTLINSICSFSFFPAGFIQRFCAGGA